MIVVDKDFNFYEALLQHGETVDYAVEEDVPLCEKDLKKLRELTDEVY